MTAGPRFDHYDWRVGERSGREAMLRFGPAGGPIVVVALPLFEEANRTRAIAVAVLRLLAERGVAGALPDLPGQGESLVPTRDARLDEWRAAFAQAVATLPAPAHIVAMRGGALIDGEARAASRWCLSPMDGPTLVRELDRLRVAGNGSLFGGNDLAPDFLTALADAAPLSTSPVRTVRLAGDPRAADATLAFAPPWRRVEPQRDDALAAALADDLAGWIASCVG